MKTIVFATNNPHKLEEARAICSGKAEIKSLAEAGCEDELPETSDTLEGNALQKARYVNERLGVACFADDTGLEVEALNGAPGVHSARYAGEECNAEANICKLLAALDGSSNRKARFRTVITLLTGNKQIDFEGVVNGRITEERRGTAGFGYDSVFVPDGYEQSFAEMGAHLKNTISHRARAVGKLAEYLALNSIILLLCVLSLSARAQNTNDWNSYQSYAQADKVAETNTKVFVLSQGALYSYGKEDKEIFLYSKLNGLNDTDVSLINYCPEAGTLVIIYSNGNIDLLDNDGITNIPQLKNTTSVQNKTVNEIYFNGKLAYLSTGFGILVLNLQKKEVADTYRLERDISSVAIWGDSIYAAGEKGVVYASLKSNLLDKSEWKEKTLNHSEIKGGGVNRLCVYDGNLIYYVKDKGVYREAIVGECIRFFHPYISDIKVEGGKFIAYSTETLVVFKNFDSFDSRAFSATKDVSALNTDGTFWIAAGEYGLLGVKQISGNDFSIEVSEIQINSPKRNDIYFMRVHNERLLITGGGRSVSRHNIPGTLMAMENGEWNNLDENAVNEEIKKLINYNSYDYLSVAVAPDDDNHYFVATYGEGVIELRDNKFVKLYNESNSPLKSSIPGSPNFVRTGSTTFDKDGNLWVTNNRSASPINIMKPDGTWVSPYYPPLNNAGIVDRILLASNGLKWVNLPFEPAIFVFDDAGTIDDDSDDRYNYITTFRDAQSSTGDYLSANEYLCIAEDLKGVIWIGTNIGLLRCGSPLNAVNNPELLSVSRLVRDGEAYFLSGESVTALAVDAANQKWIGTASQGVFLINEDGSETLYNFTAENSPLLSNNITAIALNNNSGEVFIGTDKGLVSYKSGVAGDKTALSEVSAYPNPVRPDFNDKVTITGLQSNTNIKITDVAGNLIYQGRSSGSTFVWNCRSGKGERVATGVYLVFAASSEATESVVTKIAVIK